MSQAIDDLTENIVPLHQPKPQTPADPTAAKRMRRYRKRKASKALVPFKRDATAVTVNRDASVPPIVTPAVTPTVTQNVTAPAMPSVTVEASREAVDLVQLRRDIAEYARLHRHVDRLKARERRSDRPIQMALLAVGVAFYALVAVAAVN